MKQILLIGLVIVASHGLHGQSPSGANMPGKMVLSLQQAIDLGLERNLNMQKSGLNLQSAEIMLTQSKMNRLPNANIGIGGGRNWGRSIDPTTNQFITQALYFSGIQGNANVTLFSGMQLNNAVKRDRMNMQAAELDLEKAKNDVIINVVTLYLSVMLNKELLEAARLQEESTRNQLSRTARLVEAGSLPVTNRLDMESQLAGNELDLVNAENDLTLSHLALKQALLLPAGTEIELVVPEAEVPTELDLATNVEEVYKEALQTMPEVKSADLQVQSAEVSYKIAQGGLSPKLTLGAGFSTNYSEIADRERPIFEGTEKATIPIGYLQSDPSQAILTDREVPKVVRTEPDFRVFDQYAEYLSRQVNLNLSIPIFNRFATRSDIQRAVVTQKSAEIAAQEVRNSLRQNIEAAYSNAYAALKSYSASQKQVTALEQSYSNIESRYNLGAVNYVEYQVAGNNLFRARSAWVRARYTYLFRLKILEFYQGKELTF